MAPRPPTGKLAPAGETGIKGESAFPAIPTAQGTSHSLRPMASRRVHLGIDYGTSASKLVFRDYAAPGREVAKVVVSGHSFRIPSRVCITASDLRFGLENPTTHGWAVLESVKMQVAAEVTGDPNYYFGPRVKLPDGLNASDLATLTVWYLISEGRRAIADYLGINSGSQFERNVALGMTMGVPMAFFSDTRLKAAFLNIAKGAWRLYREHGAVGPVLPMQKATDCVRAHPPAELLEIPREEVDLWIRAEAIAAMLWPFESPADIGAGTTHASTFYIYGDANTPKRGITFLGADSNAYGMDAIDKAIANLSLLGNDCLSLRGRENLIVNGNAQAWQATRSLARGEIREPYRRAWIRTCRVINPVIGGVPQYPEEQTRWVKELKIFAIGGGSLVNKLTGEIRFHPAAGDVVSPLATLEVPPDVSFPDGRAPAKDDLSFMLVAYGLSYIGGSIPEWAAPGEVPPMPDRGVRVKRLQHEDIYAR
jgi:hypothetical protein